MSATIDDGHGVEQEPRELIDSSDRSEDGEAQPERRNCLADPSVGARGRSSDGRRRPPGVALCMSSDSMGRLQASRPSPSRLCAYGNNDVPCLARYRWRRQANVPVDGA